MIITYLGCAENKLYEKINDKFEKMFELAKNVMRNTPEDGRYDVDEDMYYLIQSYKAKSPFDAKFESHREYIDVQMVISGEEIIRFDSAEKLSLCQEYKPDCEKYSMNKDYDSVRLCAGELAIIFTGEPHAPGIKADGAPEDVKKLVVKIRAK